MITELHIKNFAIIDDLVVPFGGGLNILSGETGAGKSIIVNALGMVVGDRVSVDVIRSGEDLAQVTAVFDPENISGELLCDLKEGGHDIDDGLIVKRCVFSNGKTKAFLNGQPVSLAEIKKISPYLLEISSQHEHQQLMVQNTHLDFVDKFGGLHRLRQEYKNKFEYFIELKQRLSDLERLSASAVEQREFLTYQVREIDAANLNIGEDDELEREKSVIKHAAKLNESLRQSEYLLYSSDTSAKSLLDQVAKFVESAAEIDPKISDWCSTCADAAAAVEDISLNINNYLDKLDLDPCRLDQIEERLYDLSRLKKKYGKAIEGILKKRDELAEQLNLIQNCDYEIEKVSEELKYAKEELKKAALNLSNEREKSSGKLSDLVQKELNTLSLKKTKFAPGHVVLNIDEATESGIDNFGFEISPNLGEIPKPLASIVSGGELSRIMLAIKSVLMNKVGLATLEVFDEVDVGIGGAVAEVVGRKLKQMSAKRQIICITHLPQVACFGDNHIVVSKEVKHGRTVTRFEKLSKKSRLNEIARMLGGEKITNTAVRHAEEMLSRSVQ